MMFDVSSDVVIQFENVHIDIKEARLFKSLFTSLRNLFKVLISQILYQMLFYENKNTNREVTVYFPG